MKFKKSQELLINLDADEFLTPNFEDLEWETIINAPIGTKFIFNWYNIQPNFSSYFYDEKPLASIDDGSEYKCGVLHKVRIPLEKNAAIIKLNNIGVLHYQFLNWERMELKHMWYRMYEIVINPKKNSISIWRTYHYIKNLPIDYQHVYPLPKEWMSGYNKYNIEITSFRKLQEILWDKRMVGYVSKYGWKRFKRVDIDIYYLKKLDKEGYLKGSKLKNNILDKIIIYYLKNTQKIKQKPHIKFIDTCLSFIFK